MVERLLRTLVKIAVASLIVGTILAHFGITTHVLMGELGISAERIQDLVRRGLAWAVPNMLLGSLVIVPLWGLLYILKPPGASSE